MTRFNQPVNNFNGGEISPRMRGRFDVPKYQTGAELLENFIVLPEGGIRKRSGTRYVAPVLDNDKRSRLIPFVFSTTQAYVLEFADNMIRVFANEGIVLPEARDFLDAAVEVDDQDEIAIEDHGYMDGQGPFVLTTTGTLPAGLSLATDYYVKTAQSIDADTTFPANNVFTMTAHGLTSNTNRMGPYRLVTTSQLPTGGASEVDSATDYYVEVLTADTISLYTAATGGTLKTWTVGTGAGVQTIVPTGDYARDKFRLATSSGGAAVPITAAAGGGTHTITPDAAINVEITSPYSISDLPDIHYIQSADVLYLFHPNYPIHKLSRVGNSQWSVDKVVLNDGPYGPTNTTETTLNPSAATGNRITITASSAEGINDGQGFLVTDIGRSVRIDNGASTPKIGSARIIGIQSTLIAEAEVTETFKTTPTTATWRLGAWYGPNNYPRDGTFGERRLWSGGERNTPNTIHASRTGDFEDFGPSNNVNIVSGTSDREITDDTALSFTIAANQVNAITNLATTRNVLALTRGGFYPVQASSANEAVTATSVNVPQASSRGASQAQTIEVGRQVIFASRNGQRVKALRYSFEIDSYDEDDLTVLARHVTDGSVGTLQYTDEPDSIVWMLTIPGKLWGCTFVPEQEVFAWHRHALGCFKGGRP